jgi:glycosyl hydrolase family 28
MRITLRKSRRRLVAWATVGLALAGAVAGTGIARAGTGPAGLVAAAAAGADFNDVASGSVPGDWSVSGAGATLGVVPVPDQVNRSLQLAKPAAAGAATATTSLAALTGTVRAEARVRGSGVAGRLEVLTIAGTAGPVAGIVLRAGELADAATNRALRSAADDRWYALRAELRVADQRWDLWVDGQRLLTDAPFATASTSLTALSAAVTDGFTGAVNLDDVLVRETPAPSVSYLVNDGFNDAPVGQVPAGYQVTPGAPGVAVAATPSDGDRSLRLAKSAAAGSVSAVRTFPAQSNVFFVRANLRTDELTGTKVALYLQNEVGSPAVSLQFLENYLVYTNGTTLFRLLPVTAGEWYTVHLSVNVETHQFEIYVDGRRYSPETPAGQTSVPQWPFRDPTVTAVSRLLVGVGEAQTGSVLVDNLLVYQNRPASPGKFIDVRDYGAVPDGTTLNTAAIRLAISKAGPGDRVLVAGGTFKTGSLQLKPNMTLWVARGSTLLGSQDDDDYAEFPGTPDPASPTLKALVYSIGADDVHIDGGGTIDGNGRAPQWVDCEGEQCGVKRPYVVAPIGGRNVSIRNVHIRNSAAWAITPVQVDGLLIADVNLDSDIRLNRDGIDVIDSSNVLIERVSVWADDDAICLKSRTDAGLEHVTVRLSTVGRSTRANGLKLGTDSLGGFRDVAMEDILVKHTGVGAITVDATDGGVAWQLAFRRITVDGARRAYFVLLGQRSDDKRPNPRLPSWVSGVRLEDITGTHLVEPSIVTGQVLGGTTYRIYDVTVSRVRTVVPGGVGTIPAEPVEYQGQYPESNLWTATGYGVLPAYGHFFRHVDGLTLHAVTAVPAAPDARPATALRDVLAADQS